jgi:hypothetical protein
MPEEDPCDKYEPPGSPLPNVAHDRAHGITSLIVYCSVGIVFPHSKEFSFDELQLPGDMVMIHIPRFRRFVCTRMRKSRVQIRSVWPSRMPSGPFYSPAMDQ